MKLKGSLISSDIQHNRKGRMGDVRTTIGFVQSQITNAVSNIAIYSNTPTIDNIGIGEKDERVIKKNKANLGKYMDRAEKESIALGSVLNGDQNPTGYQLSPKFLVNEGFGYKGPITSCKIKSNLHTKIDSGRDLEKLGENSRRFKFYLSFDLSSPEREENARIFARELVTQCQKDKVSLTIKPWDHDYDSFNLYTYGREKLQTILQILYNKYKNIFIETQRFFQCKIEGINSAHIAFVEEPLTGHSHSARMGILGKYIEEGKTWKEACSKIGIRPDYPGILIQ